MKRIVVKVGSSIISNDDEINFSRVKSVCDFVLEISAKFEVILVTSGAISAGKTRAKIPRDSMVNKQILAAVGQPYLMEIYDNNFAKNGKLTGQILLTAEDFDSRKRMNHARNLVNGLLERSMIPIINENDATATAEIVFGDNDSLSANVAEFFGADILVILSDIDGYYDSDPRQNPNAKIIPRVSKIKEDELNQTPKPGSSHGTGGIVTKLRAANFLLENNKTMFLSSGFDLNVAREFLLNGKQISGTLFKGLS